MVNKNIIRKQCAVMWHIDGLKISHIDPNVVATIIYELDKRFGDTTHLHISRGKVLHEYLGMMFG